MTIFFKVIEIVAIAYITITMIIFLYYLAKGYVFKEKPLFNFIKLKHIYIYPGVALGIFILVYDGVESILNYFFGSTLTFEYKDEYGVLIESDLIIFVIRVIITSAITYGIFLLQQKYTRLKNLVISLTYQDFNLLKKFNVKQYGYRYDNSHDLAYKILIDDMELNEIKSESKMELEKIIEHITEEKSIYKELKHVQDNIVRNVSLIIFTKYPKEINFFIYSILKLIYFAHKKNSEINIEDISENEKHTAKYFQEIIHSLSYGKQIEIDFYLAYEIRELLKTNPNILDTWIDKWINKKSSK